jgi:hypothetical protein
MRRHLWIAALLLFGLVGPAGGQSIFNAAGLGVPVEGLDGRARALGNLGIGLPGISLMPTDPAASARIRLSTGVMVSQPSWVRSESETGVSKDSRGSRFPLMGVAYPLRFGTVSVQIGSFLDQHYQSESVGSVTVGGSAVDATDTFDQDGSVSNVNLGFARMFGERLAAGVTLGRYAGSVVRTFKRTFDPAAIDGVDDYVERGAWSYRGFSLTAGVSADLRPTLRISASIQLPTDLDAQANEDTTGQDGSFSLPVQYRLGIGATVAPGLVLTGSALLADWASDDIVGGTRGGSASGVGVGAELSRARLLGRDIPLRFGFRRTGLPYSFDDRDAHEQVWSGGFGVSLDSDGGIGVAGGDVAIERGRRVGAGPTESFWRATFSMILSGI